MYALWVHWSSTIYNQWKNDPPKLFMCDNLDIVAWFKDKVIVSLCSFGFCCVSKCINPLLDLDDNVSCLDNTHSTNTDTLFLVWMPTNTLSTVLCQRKNLFRKKDLVFLPTVMCFFQKFHCYPLCHNKDPALVSHPVKRWSDVHWNTHRESNPESLQRWTTLPRGTCVLIF